jgi:acetylornithine deacetylase
MCKIVVDIRVNELYRFQEILETIQAHTPATVTPRSTRLKSSFIALDHPLVLGWKVIG